MLADVFVQYHDRKRHVERQAGTGAGFRRLLNGQASVRMAHERPGVAAQAVKLLPLALAGNCSMKVAARLAEDQVDNVLFVHVKNSFAFSTVIVLPHFLILSRSGRIFCR